MLINFFIRLISLGYVYIDAALLAVFGGRGGQPRL